jgi:hypothetical protein
MRPVVETSGSATEGRRQDFRRMQVAATGLRVCPRQEGMRCGLVIYHEG